MLICSTLPSLSYYIHRLRHAKQRYQVLIEVPVFPKHQSLNADESSVKKEPLMKDQWEIFFSYHKKTLFISGMALKNEKLKNNGKNSKNEFLEVFALTIPL